MAIDLTPLWNFANPALSEQRFRAALECASLEDALILQTQIARTLGMRREFAEAQEVLAAIQDEALAASPEAQVHYLLELGRTFASATHPPETQTPEALNAARSLFLQAFDAARTSELDALAIDALHMMAFVDKEPEAQLAWDRKALAYLETSTQPDAKAWEGSLRNNVGYALRLLGRYEEAIEEFIFSLMAHERAGKPRNVRIAHWMIARTYRDQERFQEALEVQLRLEREWEETGEPDLYVFEELALLYRAIGDTERAELYEVKYRASSG